MEKSCVFLTSLAYLVLDSCAIRGLHTATKAESSEDAHIETTPPLAARSSRTPY